MSHFLAILPLKDALRRDSHGDVPDGALERADVSIEMRLMSLNAHGTFQETGNPGQARARKAQAEDTLSPDLGVSRSLSLLFSPLTERRGR